MARKPKCTFCQQACVLGRGACSYLWPVCFHFYNLLPLLFWLFLEYNIPLLTTNVPTLSVKIIQCILSYPNPFGLEVVPRCSDKF